MKPIVTIARPEFSTAEDEAHFKSRLEEMRQDGYHVIGWTSSRQERPVVRVFRTSWFTQLLHFLKDREARRGWHRATEHRRERDLATKEIKRLQELALSYGAPPHHVHLNKAIADLMKQNTRGHVVYDRAGQQGIPNPIPTQC